MVKTRLPVRFEGAFATMVCFAMPAYLAGLSTMFALDGYSGIAKISVREHEQLLRDQELLAEARFQLAQQESARERLRKDNATLVHPHVFSPPRFAYKAHNISPHQRVEYFDGALTLAVRDIGRNAACISINGAICTSLAIGASTEILIGRNLYRVRLDRIGRPLQQVAQSQSVTVSILILEGLPQPLVPTASQ